MFNVEFAPFHPREATRPRYDAGLDLQEGCHIQPHGFRFAAIRDRSAVDHRAYQNAADGELKLGAYQTSVSGYIASTSE